jgi:hypothetical protein
VDEEPGPVYQASKISRAAAWLVLACAAGVSIFGILHSAGAATKAIVVSALFGLLAWAALRLEVRATPEDLVSCAGRRIYRFPWRDVRGFELDRTGRDVVVVLKGDLRHRLPIVEVATRRIRAETARDDLERYWKAHRR